MLGVRVALGGRSLWGFAWVRDLSVGSLVDAWNEVLRFGVILCLG